MYACLYRQNAHGLWEGEVQTRLEEMFLMFPQTVPKLAPEPATLTVAAPVSMNLTAVLMPLEMVLPTLEVVAKGWVKVWGHGTVRMLRLSFVSVSGHFSSTADTMEAVWVKLEQALYFRGWGTKKNYS